VGKQGKHILISCVKRWTLNRLTLRTVTSRKFRSQMSSLLEFNNVIINSSM